MAQYRQDKRRHQQSRINTGHVAKPAPPLKDATKAEASTAPIATQLGIDLVRSAGKLRKDVTAASMKSEELQIHWLEAMIGALAIQNVPTIIARVDNVFAVAGTAGSRHIGRRSSQVTAKSMNNPNQKRNSSLA